MFKKCYCLIATCILLSHANAQITVMSYNLLNFPTGNIQGRVDTLQKIADYVQPHLLMVQELKTAQGLQDITDMLNELGYGDFAHPEFIPQQSPGSPSNQLQQSLIYDTNIFRLKSQSVVLTDYRDINEYLLYLNDPTLINGTDTTFLYAYVTHLKSSTGVDNEAERLSMTNYLIQHFQTLPTNSNVLFAGDFNLYTNNEPAYLAITNENNAIVMRDIFASYGDWAGSGFPHKEILTQCTRSSVIFNDGAGGGVDDRFDFILISEALMNSSNDFSYVENSYRSLGNTGNCYNQSITDCAAGNTVPSEILRAMYYMSDHIPQVCQLHSSLFTGVKNNRVSDNPFRIQGSNLVSEHLVYARTNSNGKSYRIEVLDLNGKVVYSENNRRSETGSIDVSNYQPGMYVIQFIEDALPMVSLKFCVIR